MAQDYLTDKLLKPDEVADCLLLVFGGGGEFGLPDPELDPMVDIISDWTAQQRIDVVEYAGAVHTVASDNDGVEVPRKPKCLIDMMDAMDCQFA